MTVTGGAKKGSTRKSRLGKVTNTGGPKKYKSKKVDVYKGQKERVTRTKYETGKPYSEKTREVKKKK